MSTRRLFINQPHRELIVLESTDDNIRDTMPSRPASKGVGAAKAASRFELPVLKFEFGSLTDGTDIPPPQPSPKQEVPTPPKTPSKPEAEVKEEPKPQPQPQPQSQPKETNGQTTVAATPSPAAAISTTNGVKRPAEESPASPTLSQKGSLRRLLSRNLLNNTYDDQASGTQSASRPPSRIASIAGEERRAKRGSGFFKRFSMHDHHGNIGNNGSNIGNKRSTMMFDDVKAKPAGPPPPMIPEMSAWDSKVDVTLGDDIFNNIK